VLVPKFEFRERVAVPGRVRIACPSCGKDAEVAATVVLLVPQSGQPHLQLEVQPFDVLQPFCCMVRMIDS
jgi:hypothetical protein